MQAKARTWHANGTKCGSSRADVDLLAAASPCISTAMLKTSYLCLRVLTCVNEDFLIVLMKKHACHGSGFIYTHITADLHLVLGMTTADSDDADDTRAYEISSMHMSAFAGRFLA